MIRTTAFACRYKNELYAIGMCHRETMLRCRRKITLDTSVIVQTQEKFERDDKFQGRKKATGGAFMKTVHGGAFDPETIDLLRSVLDEAWEQQGKRGVAGS
jgi:hypothetical protein